MHSDERGIGVTREKPLNGGARFLLVLGVGVAVLSFYAFSLCAIILLAAIILAELALTVVLLRFAAHRLMTSHLQKHMRVLGLYVKSLRIKKGVEFRIPLRRENAPELYHVLARLCERLQLSFPENVSLLMGNAAFVQLKGFRGGSGKTTLGVGYDLLAGMSVQEMEGVLAHELTHAKLINRGYRNWLWSAQARIRNLAMALWAEINMLRRAGLTSRVAKTLFFVVDRMLRLCTRLVATYSRQDEFEADRGAAELCGIGPIKSALMKLDALQRVSSRLPWNERVAQLQQTSGYSQWLLQEIAKSSTAQVENNMDVLFNKYSTHPSIPDRLAALSDDAKSFTADSPSALRLLADPDKIAVKLVTELQRLLVEQEKKDSDALMKFSDKGRGSTRLRSPQVAGSFLLLGGLILGLVGLESGAPNLVLWALAAGVFGFGALFKDSYRADMRLPVPRYEELTRPAGKSNGENIGDKEKTAQAEMADLVRHIRGRNRAAKMAQTSYTALKVCDYLRAHVAARECLKYDKRSVEGALALAVACAAHGQIQDTARLLGFVQKQTRFRTFSPIWGAAWAWLLVGDWARAEAMLEKALKLQPQQTELISLLALAQYRRGKLQSSIANARKACDLFPDSAPRLKFLIARLLDGGFTREAQERMRRLSTEMEKDPEVMLSMAQFHLLRQNAAEADTWTARLQASDISPQMLVRVARYYENARFADKAANLYLQALATGHYPEAHFGLGRIETASNNKAEARKHFLAALNVDRAVGKEGTAVWPIFRPILAQMLSLHDPVPKCEAWMYAFPKNIQPAALAGQSFLVYAGNLTQAREHLQIVMNALQPEKPPMILNGAGWSKAPRPMQPDGPVRPGVQGLWQ